MEDSHCQKLQKSPRRRTAIRQSPVCAPSPCFIGSRSLTRFSVEASIFDNPAPQPATTAWVNPFKKADTSNLPDDTEDEPATKSAGSLFNKPTGGRGLFGGGGDQTWSPEKGVNFAPAPAVGSSLFSGSNANGGGLFGSSNANGKPSTTTGFFGSKPLAPPASGSNTSATTSAEASEAETTPAAEGEPSDAQPPAKPEKDLSQQGPGEEEEDSKFSTRSIVYDMDAKPPSKLGVGTLRVLKNRSNGKARVLVRNDLGKVLLNLALSKDASYVVQDNRLLRVPEFQENGKIRTWGCRVGKEDGIAEKLKAAVEEAKA